MIRYFLKHPTAANLLMAALLIAGILSLPDIKRETFPEFSPRYISATVVYPGATPEEVEESLCLRMEDAIDGLGQIEEAKCQAQEGSGSMSIKLDKQADMGKMLVDVQTRINAINDFPGEIESPIVQELDWAERVVDVAITANTSLPHLKAYAEDVKKRMKVDAGLPLVSLNNFSDHQLRVELRESSLRQLGLTVSDIASKLARQNIKLPSGNIETQDKNLLIRFDERKVTPATLGKTIIASSSTGGMIRLADIATITDRFELDENRIRFNQQPAAILTISKNKADDALRIKSLVETFVKEEQARAPDGITLTMTSDLSSVLWDRLTMMARNGGQGILLVFGVMWLFFSLRYSFWVAAGLPVAFLGSIMLMSQLGISINIISLVALLMAIGIMMDDAIVISESIAAHIDRGMEIDDAVLAGVKKVLPGVVSSYLTTVCIFGSLLFLEGQMGAVLKVIPQVLILVLTLSLMEAFLILPHHLAHSLHKKKASDRQPLAFKQQFLDRFERFRNGTLVNAVSKVIEWRYLFIGSVLSLLLASIALIVSGAVYFIGFPEVDGDQAEVRIILPPGSTLNQTTFVVNKVVASAEKLNQQFSANNEDGQPLIENIAERYNFNPDASESGPHIATVKVDLRSAELRNTLLDDFLNAWRKEVGELPELIALVFTEGSFGPSGRAIEVRVQHQNLETLKAASLDIQSFLGTFDGVSNLMDDMRRGKEEVVISLRPGAESFGVDGQLIASQLRGTYFGQTADEIQVGPENLKIQVQMDSRDISSLDNLTNLPVILSDGSQAPLATIAILEYQRNFVRIQRINGLRTLTITGDVDQNKASARQINDKLRRELLPTLKASYPGIRFGFEGEVKENAKTSNSMTKGFMLGLFGIFAILSFQFRNYFEPFVVMLAIPLALIGVIWGHFLLGYSLSMPSIMGFVSLAGIVVNDSILLVQYIRHHIDAGESIHQSVVMASRDRFRAVFLTSVTTAVGLLPLLLERSLQAQVVQPLVISIVFGIFASTLMVLFVIPAAYAILADFGVVKSQR
ncbi:efflux RND transporter permease subunit [Endozoicomonas sp.]|uniref:efflux RND transporter permease subunit n=1 Tax=Endozoicomonas sp. TaxID=1892382 RepID=UPI002885457D|nr:efflux RND transporter permease subunit [Endozoicomonas sp.]